MTTVALAWYAFATLARVALYTVVLMLAAIGAALCVVSRLRG